MRRTVLTLQTPLTEQKRNLSGVGASALVSSTFARRFPVLTNAVSLPGCDSPFSGLRPTGPLQIDLQCAM
eukprot:3729817-Rhodomonas_salina.2